MTASTSERAGTRRGPMITLSVAPRVLEIAGIARARAADPDLRQGGHVVHLGDPPHDVAVALAHAEPLVHEVKVRVDLHDADRANPAVPNARMIGIGTAWSPPSTTGITPRSRIFPTAASMFARHCSGLEWIMSTSPTSTIRTPSR